VGGEGEGGMIIPDGIFAAAEREVEFHPKTLSGKPISAWERRGTTLAKTIAEVNKLRSELDALREMIASRPF
jgi:hypothetical protein